MIRMENPPPSRILIVDDDQALCRLLADYLQREGFVVDVAHDGDAALTHLRNSAERPDLLILDVMMPGRDGLDTLRELRVRHRLPVIMLSARGEPVDRVIGLELGADDYLAKPCNPRELLARVRAVMRRRREPRVAEDSLGAACEFAGWRLDLVRHELRSPQGVVVNLSSGEFSLLRAFVERPQRVLTRDQLLEFARGPQSDSFDRAIDVQISRLRRKLEDSGGAVELIRTVRSEGYIFTPRVTRSA